MSDPIIALTQSDVSRYFPKSRCESEAQGARITLQRTSRDYDPNEIYACHATLKEVKHSYLLNVGQLH